LKSTIPPEIRAGLKQNWNSRKEGVGENPGKGLKRGDKKKKLLNEKNDPGGEEHRNKKRGGKRAIRRPQRLNVPLKKVEKGKRKCRCEAVFNRNTIGAKGSKRLCFQVGE